jgi:L-fuconolactonase
MESSAQEVASCPAVDAHAHVVSYDNAQYPFKAANSDLPQAPGRETVSIEQLRTTMRATGVKNAILVQRAQLYGYDNSYVCDAAAECSDVVRAVCAVDARNPDCGTAARQWLRRGAAGFRLMQQDRDEGLTWLAGDSADPLWRLSSEHGLPLCVHFFPWNRVRGLQLLKVTMTRFPEVIVVIDHLSNCPLDTTGQLLVDEPLQAVADLPNALAKITTIPLGSLARDGVSLDGLVQKAVALFGPEKLMWGTDIGQSQGTYEQMVSYGRLAVASLSADAQQAVLAGNAVRTYYGLRPAVSVAQLNDTGSRNLRLTNMGHA